MQTNKYKASSNSDTSFWFTNTTELDKSQVLRSHYTSFWFAHEDEPINLGKQLFLQGISTWTINPNGLSTRTICLNGLWTEMGYNINLRFNEPGKWNTQIFV
jgi:hypothetical protein